MTYKKNKLFFNRPQYIVSLILFCATSFLMLDAGDVKTDTSTTQSIVQTADMSTEKSNTPQNTVKLSNAHKNEIAQSLTNETSSTAQKNSVACLPHQPSLISAFVQTIKSFFNATVTKTKDTLSSLFSSTGSWLIRFLAAFLLGVLLSLTPCIYPMIPITIGILQSSGSTSPFKNFLLAGAYTLGISTTFALLGLIAAIGSCVFGEMQGSAFFIIPLAAILIYFGLTMFDVVQMYVPRFLQPKTGKVKGGSLLSAYIFGAISGTVASPCLSPGLILILNYVAQSTQLVGYLTGFLLLFIFGIGSSLPLLIIGTFSGSLSVLPKAGQWMVEIKKLVGIMLISMAFYHLSHLSWLPWYMFIWVVVLFFLGLGIYYFASIKRHDKTFMRWYKNLMGLVLIITSCMLTMNGFKAVMDHLYPMKSQSNWLHSYDQAVKEAAEKNKLLFIDIGATYCSACKHIDSRIFTDSSVQKALENYVLLKIESDVHTTDYAVVKSKYGSYIEGFPTFLIVDPKNGVVIKKWSIDIEELGITALNSQLEKISKM